MIIFLYGKDTYRMKQKLKEIIDGYKNVRKSGLNLRYFEGDGEILTNLKDEIRQASMFKEKKLAVLLNPFNNVEFKQGFLEEAKDFLKSEDIIVIYQEELVNKNNALFKFLKKEAKTQEFELLTTQKLSNWIKRESKKYQAEIDSDALHLLIDYIGNDLWRMSNEIKKLASYDKHINAECVKLLIRPKIETDIFKTIDAIAQKNKKQALGLLHKHLGNGDSPLYLLSMINYQFRNLLIVKDLIEKSKPYYVILKKSGLHPFVVKKTYYSAQQFNLSELKDIYIKIFKIDMEIKTGRIEPRTALDLLIAEI